MLGMGRLTHYTVMCLAKQPMGCNSWRKRLALHAYKAGGGL